MKLLIMNIENIEIANRTAQIIVHKGHFEMPPVDTSVLQIRVHDYTYLSYYLTKRYCWCSKGSKEPSEIDGSFEQLKLKHMILVVMVGTMGSFF